MSALIFGLFGLLFGSFLNVVILRRGVQGLGGRSACMHCAHELSALDLIPVFSYLALRGRCRYCKGSISAQYPLVEASTAVFFALIGGSPLPLGMQLLALFIGCLLICITVYDIRHTIIPDEWVYPFAALALVMSVLGGMDIPTVLLTGIASAAPFALLWTLSRGKWMGLGDAKIALGIGFLLGPWDSYMALTSAFVVGALFFIPLMVVARFTPSGASPQGSGGLTMRSEVPLGPFLILACITVWILTLYNHDPAGPFSLAVLP